MVDTDNERHTHVPPFAMNTLAYGRCRQCKEIDTVNHHNLCDDCVHANKLQAFADNVADLLVGDNYNNRLMLTAVIESAQLLRRR